MFLRDYVVILLPKGKYHLHIWSLFGHFWGWDCFHIFTRDFGSVWWTEFSVTTTKRRTVAVKCSIIFICRMKNHNNSTGIIYPTSSRVSEVISFKPNLPLNNRTIRLSLYLLCYFCYYEKESRDLYVRIIIITCSRPWFFYWFTFDSHWKKNVVLLEWTLSAFSQYFTNEAVSKLSELGCIICHEK